MKIIQLTSENVKRINAVSITPEGAIVGHLTLDPLAFVRLPPKQQAEMLKGLVGLDFSALDRERAERYAERTAVNRSLASAEAQVGGMSFHNNVPSHEISLTNLTDQYRQAQQRNTESLQRQNDLEALCSQRGLAEEEISDLKDRIEHLQEKVANQSRRIAELDASIGMVEDLAPIQKLMSAAETINRKVRDNQQVEKARDAAARLSNQSQVLTERIEEIDGEKRDKLAAAAFPIPGLSFDDSGVIYQGVPFAQASGAEQLRASVAIGLAMNPKLRVLLIRDGSLLDAEGLAMLGAVAEENDAQVWIERVNDDGNVAGAKQGVE